MTDIDNLIFSEPPFFIKKPAPLKVALVGGDLVLECEPGGDPAPRVRWSKQGQPGGLDMSKVRYTTSLMNKVTKVDKCPFKFS